jgi:molecular chaperone DnaK
MGTGKEQSIKITASSGLSEDEINKMQQDAELHAEEDKKRKELVEAVNQADSLVYATEKSLKDLGDKVDEETKSNVEKEVESLKKIVEKGDNVDDLKAGIESLTQASHKLAEIMYSQATQEQAGEQPGPGEGPEAGGAGGAAGEDKSDEDVVDADFEEVK